MESYSLTGIKNGDAPPCVTSPSVPVQPNPHNRRTEYTRSVVPSSAFQIPALTLPIIPFIPFIVLNSSFIIPRIPAFAGMTFMPHAAHS